MKPLVSIVVPVYNDERHVEASLLSLLAQTYRPIELIVCDDASTDNSFAICQRLAAQFPEIKLLRNSVNLGVTGNFNRLRGAASGQYVMLRSANDRLHPSFLEKAVPILEANPEIALVHALSMQIGPQDEELGPYPESYNIDSTGMSLPDGYLEVLRCFSAGDINYGLIRAEILAKAQTYGWFNSPDCVFIAEIALYGKIKLIREYLQFRRKFQEDSRQSRLRYLQFASRRTHRSKSTGIEIQFDPRMLINFIDLTYRLLEMLANADIDLTLKEELADKTVEATHKRWGKVMQAELGILLSQAEELARYIGQAPNILMKKAFQRQILEEFAACLAAAHMVFPDNAAIKLFRQHLLDLYM